MKRLVNNYFQRILVTILLVIGSVHASECQLPAKGDIRQQAVQEYLSALPEALPRPKHWWILFSDISEKIYRDYLGGDTGRGYGNIYAYPNRFLYRTGAVGLSDNAYIELERSYLEFYDPKKGFTISFWIYTNGDDGQIFYAKDKDGNNLFGMSIQDRQLSVDRYIDSGKGQRPWKLWFWNPISFWNTGERAYWYQVILVCKGNTHDYEDKGSFMSVYIGRPDGTQGCRHNYFLPQDLSKAIKWGFGNPVGKTVTAMSDFKVYDGAFSELDARASFDSERPFMGNVASVRLISKATDKVASVADHSKSDDAKVWQYTWEDENDQTWQAMINQPIGDEQPLSGMYSLFNKNSSKVMEVPGKDAFRNGAQIVQNRLGTGNNQLWEIEWLGIEDDGRSYYRVINWQSMKVLDVPNGSKDNKRILVQWDWGDSDQQKWYIEEVPRSFAMYENDLSVYNLINRNSNKLLNLDGDAFLQNVNITQNNWVGATNQQWILTHAGFDEGLSKPYFRILNKKTWQPIGIAADGTKLGDKIVQYPNCHGNSCPNVLWYLDYWGTDSNGPYFRIVNRNSGMVVQVTDASSQNGAQLDQWTWTSPDGNDNQKWYINKLENFPLPDFKNGAYLLQNLWSTYEMNGTDKYVTQQTTGTPWTFYYLGEGKYQILNKNSKLVLEYQPGESLMQGQWKNADYQKWYVFHPDPSKEDLVILNSKTLDTIAPLEQFKPGDIFFREYGSLPESYYWKAVPQTTPENTEQAGN